jgi:hypothetical protein
LRSRPAAIVLAATIASLPAFFLATEAWPEIVVPAYFITRGGVLYDTIIFPHTPLLILATALLGKLFGFSAILFRVIVGLSMAAGGAIVAFGSRQRTIAVATFIAITLVAGACTLWPDPFLAPLALAAALLLERSTKRSFIAGAMLLGVAIIIKQTSAWLAIAGLVWVIANRRDWKTYLAAISLPYAAFLVIWALLFRTTSHFYWTFLALVTGHGGEIHIIDPAFIISGAALLAIIIAATSAGGRDAWRSPLSWIAIGAFGMAWPRTDLLHVSASFAIVAVLIGRAAEVKRSFAIAAVALIAICIPLIHWRVGGPVFFWNDRATTFYTAQVRRHVRPGGAFLNFNTQNETLYATTGTTTPSGIYVNPKFWYYLNKRRLGEQLCGDLRAKHGTPILFSYLDAHVEDPRSAATCLYAICSRAPIVEEITPATQWRLEP